MAANPFLTRLDILEFYIDTLFCDFNMYINMQRSRVLKQLTALFFQGSRLISSNFVGEEPAYLQGTQQDSDSFSNLCISLSFYSNMCSNETDKFSLEMMRRSQM